MNLTDLATTLRAVTADLQASNDHAPYVAELRAALEAAQFSYNAHRESAPVFATDENDSNRMAKTVRHNLLSIAKIERIIEIQAALKLALRNWERST